MTIDSLPRPTVHESASHTWTVQAAAARRGDVIRAVLLGMAVGDSLCLPFEGAPWRLTVGLAGKRPRHRFLFGRGMVSDDTEHAAFTVRALAAACGDLETFRRTLAWELRIWFAGFPPGIGMATLKACLKLCVGISPRRSATRSAGNGATMRAPVIGAAYPANERLRHEMVRASTAITHSDPRAWTGSRAVADLVAAAAGHGSTPPLADLQAILVREGDGRAWQRVVRRLLASSEAGGTTQDFALAIAGPKGVTGFVEHSIPVAIHAYLEHGRDFEGLMSAVIACGGDTDSVAAIAGAFYGATWGEADIPRELTDGIADWPWNPRSLRGLAHASGVILSGGCARLPRRAFLPAVWARNVAFFAIAVPHVAMGIARKALGLRYGA